MDKNFADFKIGDEVDVVDIVRTNTGHKVIRKRTKIISEKGVRIKKYQVQYRRGWYDEGCFGNTINFAGGELKRMEW